MFHAVIFIRGATLSESNCGPPRVWAFCKKEKVKLSMHCCPHPPPQKHTKNQVSHPRQSALGSHEVVSCAWLRVSNTLRGCIPNAHAPISTVMIVVCRECARPLTAHLTVNKGSVGSLRVVCTRDIAVREEGVTLCHAGRFWQHA